MRKSIVLLMVLSALVFGANAAFALPTLQLDVSGGVYGAEETIYSTTNPFTLYALGNGVSFTDSYFLSIAVVPKQAQVSPSPDLGKFTINGVTIAVTADMVYGTPHADQDLLASHGIYETYYKEMAFNFDATKTASAYNSQVRPGGFQASPTGTLNYMAFDLDVSGLNAGIGLHFDLYHKTYNTKKNKWEIDEFAPFSHDAQTGVLTPTPTTPPVPEPGTLLLLGAGLIGLLGFGRKLKK